MIIHRTNRDLTKCRNKYGEAWKEYERQVPYLYIPVSLLLRSEGEIRCELVLTMSQYVF